MTNKITNEDAYIHNMQAIDTILREMKEVSELPSEQANPSDTFALTRVEFPDSGGILTYMQGQKYPYKGFPMGEFVEKNDLMKKLSKGILSGYFHQIFRVKDGKVRFKNLFSPLKLLLFILSFRIVVRAEIYSFHRMIERYRLKPHRYCDAVRELYRAGTSDSELGNKLRDIVCMHLEMDNAYRYRFQDIAEVFDRKEFEKNPIKEILRNLTIMQEREIRQEIKDSWTLTKMLVNYLRFDKEIREIVVNTLKNLDIDKVKLSIEDRSYCEPRKDYKFGFMQK